MGAAGDVAIETSKQGFNCSQSVLSAFAERLGMSREEAMKVAAGFGGGIGRMGLTCGAVTGAIMAIGLKTGATRGDDLKSKQRTYEVVQKFMTKFRERQPSLACRELIGTDISTAEGFEEAKRTGVLNDVCPRAIRDACEILEELLAETA